MTLFPIGRGQRSPGHPCVWECPWEAPPCWPGPQAAHDPGVPGEGQGEIAILVT